MFGEKLEKWSLKKRWPLVFADVGCSLLVAYNLRLRESQLGSEDATLSLIFSMNYKWVAAAVPMLVFGATALMKLSRERRQPWPGFAAGAMLILALFMAIEPIGHLAFGGAPAIMLVHSARLIVLGVMVYYSATMFIDSLLLRWVHDLLGDRCDWTRSW